MKRLRFELLARKERGSALILSCIVVTVISLITSALLVQGNAVVAYSHQSLRLRELRYAANAGVAEFRYQVSKSVYDATGNVWLHANARPNPGSLQGTDLDNVDGLDALSRPNLVDPLFPPQIVFEFTGSQGQYQSSQFNNQAAVSTKGGGQSSARRLRVNIHVFDLGQGSYRGIATATDLATGSTANRALDVNELDTFARYLYFVDDDQVTYASSTTVRGDIHDNTTVGFNPGSTFFGDVTASDGFNFYNGANFGNVSFNGEVDSNADHQDLPPLSDVEELQSKIPTTESQFNIEDPPTGYWKDVVRLSKVYSTRIHFAGDRVTIGVRGRREGSNRTRTYWRNFPLPEGGVIYSEKTIRSFKGSLNGRVTVSTRGSAYVTGSIRQIDEDGDYSFRLMYDSGFGKEEVMRSSSGDYATGFHSDASWKASNGYSYEENPAYNPSNPSSAGLVARGSVYLHHSTPKNLELHAAYASLTGTRRPDPNWKGGAHKNFRVVGAQLFRDGPSRYPAFPASGEYIFDKSLSRQPPPHYLGQQSPVFGAVRAFSGAP
jgi:hypothetical protein